MRSLWACALAVAGIGACTVPCKEQTVFLRYTLVNGAEAADTLDVTLAIGANPPQTRTLSRNKDGPSSSIEIDFGAYPAGQSLAFTLTARAGGEILGSSSQSITASPGCSSISIEIDGARVDLDGFVEDGFVEDAGLTDAAENDLTCVPSVAQCPADACGAVDDGCGSPIACQTLCLLAAAHPELAKTGETITLEGTFGVNNTVLFPGSAAPVAITRLGAQRATVIVPATATAGALVLSTAAGPVGSHPFRRVSFDLELGRFSANHEQADGARASPRLGSVYGTTSHVLGDHVYLVGAGHGSEGPTGTALFHAAVYRDGTLGDFESVLPATSSLVVPRTSHAAVVVGRYLYVFGGTDGAMVLDSVERATIASDGVLGPFTSLSPAVKLVAARKSATAVVAGDGVYVLGGYPVWQSVERATIRPDGSLSTFVSQPNGLQAPRHGHEAVVIGSYLHLVGGASSDGTEVLPIESARVNADGSLQGFVAGPSLPSGRWRYSLAVVGGWLYVIGGLLPGPPSIETTEVFRAPVGLDGALGSFVGVAGSAPLNAHNSGSATVVGNALYLAGGTTSLVERAAIGTAAKPSIPFAPGGPLGSAREGAAQQVAGRWLHVTGGKTAAGVANTVEAAAVRDDGSLGPFSASTAPAVTLATARHGHTLVRVGNFLYAIGGKGSSAQLLATVERASFKSDGSLDGTFVVVNGVALTTARAYHASVVLEDKLYVIGGEGAGTSIEKADLLAGGALSNFVPIATPLLTGRMGHSVAVVGNRLHVLHGRVPGGADRADSEYATFDAMGTLGTFTAGASTTARVYHASVVVGETLYLFGGEVSGPALATGWEPFALDRALSTITGGAVVGTVPLGGRAPGTRLLGNFVHLIGGTDGSFLPSAETRMTPLQ